MCEQERREIESLKFDRMFLLVTLIVTLALAFMMAEDTCHAQDEPPAKPIPVVKVKLTCRPMDLVCLSEFNARPGQTWYAEYPVTRKTADRKFLLDTLGSVGANILDVEFSVAMERTHPGGKELNPLFFSARPTRARYYEVTLPVTGALAYLSWHYKRQDDALSVAGVEGHKYAKWWVPNALNQGLHVAGFLATFALSR